MKSRILNILEKLAGDLRHIQSSEEKPFTSKTAYEYEVLKHETLKKYELRRSAITESPEQINGIFCIYDGTIIPDYFSEYLISEKDSQKEKFRYYIEFFKNYISIKYPELSFDDKYLPHGRVNAFPNMTVLYLDRCYLHNVDIIDRLCELYRISGRILVVWNGNYCCHMCENSSDDGKPSLSYFMEY